MLETLYTKEDITVGKYFIVTKEIGVEIYNSRYRNCCLKITALDFPYITYIDTRWKNGGIINVNDIEMKFIKPEFAEAYEALS